MKTALKQLIDYMEHGGAGSENPFEIKRYAKLLLEVEKQQIMDAYWNGADEFYPVIDTDKIVKSEQYYNKTYKE